MKKKLTLLMAALLLVSLVPVYGFVSSDAAGGFQLAANNDSGMLLTLISAHNTTPPSVNVTPPAIDPPVVAPPPPPVSPPSLYVSGVARTTSRRSAGAADGRRVATVPRVGAETINIAGVAVEVQRDGSRAYLYFNNIALRDLVNNATGNVVSFDLAALNNFDNVREARIPKNSLQRFANAGLTVELHLPLGTVALSPEAIRTTLGQGISDNISVSILTVAPGTLSSRQRSALQQDDVIRRVKIMSGRQEITNFGGPVTVTIPINWTGQTVTGHLAETGTFTSLTNTTNTEAQTTSFTTEVTTAVFLARSAS